MKITKTREDVNRQENARKVANIKCHICPECGESKDRWEFCKKGNKKRTGGILNAGYKIQYKGMFKQKRYRIDCYKCLTCGVEWQSEPYLDE